MTIQDHIFIDHLTVPCRVGTTEEERAQPQPLTVSVRMFLDLENAGKADDLTMSSDYGLAVDRIRIALRESQYFLVEAVAEKISAVVMLDSKVGSVVVRVEKRVWPDVGGVGVEIVRQRSSS